MLPVALSRKITVFQRIGASARTAANRSIVTQARRALKNLLAILLLAPDNAKIQIS